MVRHSNGKPPILVDMDGVLADFVLSYITIWNERYGDQHPMKRDMWSYTIPDNAPAHLREQASAISYERGFFLNLHPIPGGIEAIHELERLGHPVRLCTMPLEGSAYVILEKQQWAERHLGRGWKQKTLIVPDKTLVHGRILIDDNPDIVGHQQPTWEHVLYDAPYNQHVNDKRRITWENWKEGLADLLQ